MGITQTAAAASNGFQQSCKLIMSLFLQAEQRRIRQWRLLYGIQALGDKWRALERRKDRQRQAFDAAIGLATDTDFQQSLEEAKEQVDQAVSIEVRLYPAVESFAIPDASPVAGSIYVLARLLVW